MSYLKDKDGYAIIKEVKPVRVAIIGSAKTLDDMKKDLFSKMATAVAKTIDENVDIARSGITLVSGGSSWADHVAVHLFLTGDYGRLTLYLPCEWDCLKVQYQDTGAYDWKTNPGGMLNQYHRGFSKRAIGNSLKEIDEAHCRAGFDYTVAPGFHARNRLIAENCDILIAITRSSNAEPDDGGTAYTWRHAPESCKKIHLNVF